MNPLHLCACGRVHLVVARLFGIAVVACARLSPDMWHMVETDRMLPREIHVPRPETVW